MWLGCDHKNKLTGREDCSYCVHQWCVGIYYNKAENLAEFPFYCPDHGKKKHMKLNSRK